MCWFGAIFSFSGSGLSEEREFWKTVCKCASTMCRLRTVPRDEDTPSLRISLEMVIVMIDLLLLVVGHWGSLGEFKRRQITMRRA